MSLSSRASRDKLIERIHEQVTGDSVLPKPIYPYVFRIPTEAAKLLRPRKGYLKSTSGACRGSAQQNEGVPRHGRLPDLCEVGGKPDRTCRWRWGPMQGDEAVNM